MARARKAPAAEPVGDIIDISQSTVRIGSRTMTVGLALSRGLIRRVEGGATLTARALDMLDTQGAKAVAREDRSREWRRKQGIADPATTEDGVLIKRKLPEPLMPKNVKNGEPVEDDETLEQIAERTAAIEKAHLAELEDEADG